MAPPSTLQELLNTEPDKRRAQRTVKEQLLDIVAKLSVASTFKAKFNEADSELKKKQELIETQK